MTVSHLTDIALGTARLADARNAIQCALEDGTEQSGRRVYTALRAWVWKALDGRRRDDELREWFDLFKRTSAAMATRHAAEAARIVTLYELIYESISAAEVAAPADVMRREHVRRIMTSMARAGGRMARSRIGEESGLKQANLTRILNLMASARLIERTPFGKRALFQLTKLGEEELSRLEPRTAKTRPSVDYASNRQYNPMPPHLGAAFREVAACSGIIPTWKSAGHLVLLSRLEDLVIQQENMRTSVEAVEAATRKNLTTRGVQPMPAHANTYLECVGGHAGLGRKRSDVSKASPMAAQERVSSAAIKKKHSTAPIEEKRKLDHAY